MRSITLPACLFLLVVQAAVSRAALLENVAPERIGLSAKTLSKLTAYLEAEVEQGKVAGAVVLLARHGRVGYAKAVGHSDRNAMTPMKRDSLFRIASMTKPVTSVAVMMLVEEGKLRLDDPLSRFVPEFAEPRVLVSVDGDSIKTRRAAREPTIHDLLAHTSGITYGWFGPPKLDALYRQQNVPDLFIPIDETIGERVARIARVPLKFDPGANWEYGLSLDVLGRVVESASGLTLAQFFRERIFRPLQMNDTFFYVPDDKLDRLATLYTVENDNLVRVGNKATQAGFLKFSGDYCHAGARRFFSGGGGLVSTADDYSRFLQMLLNRGELGGVRILQPDTVTLMTSNQIGELSVPFAGHGDGFGYGFGVLTERGVNDDVARVGTFSWGGIFNTYFWADPQEQFVGVLMTQVFPNNHLSIRTDVKKQAYDALDDSGFEKLYWYQPGAEYNPHFNKRQLRVNAPQSSTHPQFAQRSEVRSSGAARIMIDEDLRTIRGARLYAEIWGGHPKTVNKRVSVNGRSLHRLRDVGTASGSCTHQYVTFALLPEDLVNGYNTVQFACDKGDTFWGHYIVDNVALAVGLEPDDDRLSDSELDDFSARVEVQPTGEHWQLRLVGADKHLSKISHVDFYARYTGYDENGNQRQTNWHGMTKNRNAYGHVGTVRAAPFSVGWNTRILPAQPRAAVRAVVHFKDYEQLVYRTPATEDLSITKPAGVTVKLISTADAPKPFWSRAGRKKTCTLRLDVDPADVVDAILHVTAWTGGAGGVQEYFTLNDHHFPVAEGSGHEVVYSRTKIDPKILRKGDNVVELLSDTQHHGLEILEPGPALAIRVKTDKVSLIRDSRDESAGGLECFEVRTPVATYLLEKTGGGLSSLLDAEGNDWIGFHPKPGSGAAGEYRGFPNAVFKEAGSYFHPRNAATDQCTSTVAFASDQRVTIAVEANNNLWAGRYDFFADHCTFTMTKKPANHRYWILYEGTPGGTYDDDGWWMTSASPKKHQLSSPRQGDVGSPEWIAFGDRALDRSLLLLHHEDDEHPDDFYPMEKKMTVFGFGRSRMKKYLDSAPQSFSIGLVESSEHSVVAQTAEQWLGADDAEPVSSVTNAPAGDIRAYEHFALTHDGDPNRGRRLFADEKVTRCAVCHKAGDKKGGDVGPDLSKIGGKFDRPHLVESLLEPSRQIVEGYRSSIIAAADGSVYTGVVKERTAQKITLADAQGKRHTLQISEVHRKKPGNISLMPADLHKQLRPEQFTDLIAYLETLRSGIKATPGSKTRGRIHLPNGFQVETVATNLTGCTALETTADGRIFLCEQTGALRVIKDGKLVSRPLLEVSVDSTWERGLIGVTVHPGFPTTPYAYVCYVAKDPYPHHRVSRFTVKGDVALAGSEKILLRGDDQRKLGGHVSAGHQGGALHFGPDGKLYIAIGEQTAKQPSQRLDTFQGKLLRINPDGTIPEDNPFITSTTGKYRAIWSLGLRNPFTFAFRRSDGLMLINDVGGKYEEINRGAAGGNYGWPTVEHGPTKDHRFIGPIHYYPQASINGGDFLDVPTNWPDQYHSRYFFADFVHGWIKVLDPDSPTEAAPFVGGLRRPVDLRFAADGNLYVLLRNAWVIDGKFQKGTGSLLRFTVAK